MLDCALGPLVPLCVTVYRDFNISTSTCVRSAVLQRSGLAAVVVSLDYEERLAWATGTTKCGTDSKIDLNSATLLSCAVSASPFAAGVREVAFEIPWGGTLSSREARPIRTRRCMLDLLPLRNTRL